MKAVVYTVYTMSMNVSINIRATKSERAKYNKLAKESEMTLSDLIRKLLDEYGKKVRK